MSTRSSVNKGIIEPRSTSSTFDWEIKEFSMDCKCVGSSIVSPEFSIQVEGIRRGIGFRRYLGVTKWRLELYCNGCKDTRKDDLDLFIQYLGNNTISAKVTLSLLKNDNSKVLTQSMTSNIFDAESCKHGFEKFTIKKFIMDAKNGVLVNDTLKIQCKIIISNSLYTLQEPTENLLSVLKRGEEGSPLICRLKEFDDYEKLLENGNFSDIAIVVGEEQFLVHKAIITSRSTVFEAMFRHDMKEKEENTIEITDIKSEVMKEILRFIYAGKVSRIKQMTSDLLMAAEKYSITGLKKLCVQTMLKNLKIENALEILKLADMCNAPDLKSRVIEFIASNQKAIAEKPEFGIFKDLHSDLQFELVQAIIANNSNQ